MTAPLSATLFLSAVLIVCWAFTLGLTWAPCYSQVCPERYHPLTTRMHIVAYYALVASILFALLFRASNGKIRAFSQRHLSTRQIPVFRQRITVGGLLLAIWIVGVVLATAAYWVRPLQHYWTSRFVPTGWGTDVPKVVLTGIFAHHADILLGLLLIPVGRNSFLAQGFHLHQHTLLYAHKLLAYLLVLSVIAHGATYYTFVAAWIAVPLSGNLQKKLSIDLENPNLAITDLTGVGKYYGVSLFTGTLTFALMLVVVGSSLPVVRRKAYNTFYYFHILLSCLIFVGTCMHSSTNFYLLLPGLLLWVIDWVWRFFRGDTGLIQTVEGSLETVRGGWLRIALPPSVRRTPPLHPSHLDGEAARDSGMIAHPLQTYYLTIPSVSKLQNHAFSAATVGAANSGPIFLFQRTSLEGKSERSRKRAMKHQWTWKIGQKASEADGDQPVGGMSLRIRAEGPYLSSDRDFATADRILCLVGGTGVTGALSLANWFVTHRMQESKASFTVVWTIRDASTALLPEWQELIIRSMETAERLRLRTYVSSEYGRLNVDAAIRSELAGEGRAGEGVAWVYVSGPAGFLTAAEDTCCDIEEELRVAKKAKTASGFAVDTLSHFAAQWEV